MEVCQRRRERVALRTTSTRVSVPWWTSVRGGETYAAPVASGGGSALGGPCSVCDGCCARTLSPLSRKTQYRPSLDSLNCRPDALCRYSLGLGAIFRDTQQCSDRAHRASQYYRVASAQRSLKMTCTRLAEPQRGSTSSTEEAQSSAAFKRARGKQPGEECVRLEDKHDRWCCSSPTHAAEPMAGTSTSPPPVHESCSSPAGRNNVW